MAARSTDSFLVHDEIIPLYGIGQTPQAAMDDYRSGRSRYYESLEADADRIAESLQVQLGILRRDYLRFWSLCTDADLCTEDGPTPGKRVRF